MKNSDRIKQLNAHLNEGVRSTAKAWDEIDSMMKGSPGEDGTILGQIHIDGASSYNKKAVEKVVKKFKFVVDRYAGSFIDISTKKPVKNKLQVKKDMAIEIMDVIPGTTVNVNIF